MKNLEPDYKAMASPLPTAGQMLVEGYLEPMGISQSAFARHIGVDPCVISGLVVGRRGLTMDMAFKFAAALNTTPQMWMNIQMLHDLTKAYSEKRDEKIAGRIKPMPAMAADE